MARHRVVAKVATGVPEARALAKQVARRWLATGWSPKWARLALRTCCADLLLRFFNRDDHSSSPPLKKRMLRLLNNAEARNGDGAALGNKGATVVKAPQALVFRLFINTGAGDGGVNHAAVRRRNGRGARPKDAVHADTARWRVADREDEVMARDIEPEVLERRARLSSRVIASAQGGYRTAGPSRRRCRRRRP